MWRSVRRRIYILSAIKKNIGLANVKNQISSKKNNKGKVVDIIRLINSKSYRIRLIFKVEIWKNNNWIPTKILLNSGAERNFITQIFINEWNLESSK